MLFTGTKKSLQTLKQESIWERLMLCLEDEEAKDEDEDEKDLQH
jgi:hypothetical protein